MPYWHYTDAWILTDVLGYARHEAIDARIVPVDLGARPGALRPPLLALLEALCDAHSAGSGTSPPSCAQRRLSLPASVLMDIVFTRGSGDARLVGKLRDVILALRRAGVAVYAAVDPGSPPVPEIYTALSGMGHTEISVVPLIPTGFAWYRRTANVDGRVVSAMPLAVKPIEGATDQEGTALIPIGPHATFAQDYWAAPDAIKSLREDAGFGASVKPGRLYGKTLVVGNGATDVQLPGDRTGFEIAVWAMSDWFADPRVAQRLQSQPDVFLMIVLTIVASLLAAIVFTFVFPRVRTRPFGYAIAFVAGTAAVVVAVTGFEAIALLRNLAFSQVSLVFVGAFTASGIAVRASSDDVRHERFLRDMWARSQDDPADRFDVFISYARDPNNAKWVHDNVYLPLSALRCDDGRPLRIFFDRESIVTGMDWYDRIVRSIHGTRIFLPVYSRGYFRRWFCRDELELAFLRRRDDAGFILPITRVGYKLPRRYASIQALDANSPMFVDDLTRALTRSLEAEQS